MDWFSPIRQVFDFSFPFLAGVPVIRGLLGFIIVFFLPGFAWTLVFFKQIKVIERIALSFGLSIALVTLSVLVLNLLFGVKITGLNSLLTIFGITIIPVAFYYLKGPLRNKFGKVSKDAE
ncbi:DUF1616 domain-containing protein [Chloroflexota bacterium]